MSSLVQISRTVARESGTELRLSIFWYFWLYRYTERIIQRVELLTLFVYASVLLPLLITVISCCELLFWVLLSYSSTSHFYTGWFRNAEPSFTTFFYWNTSYMLVFCYSLFSGDNTNIAPTDPKNNYLSFKKRG